MEKLKTAPGWAVRKVAYAVVALVVGILGAFGIASEVQADQWTEHLNQLVPWILGFVAPTIAYAKTGPESDPHKPSADAVAERVMVKMRAEAENYGEHAQKAAKDTVESMRDYAARMRGE